MAAVLDPAVLDPAVLADIRLQREYDSGKRRLIRLARRRCRLPGEDCEEIADGTSCPVAPPTLQRERRQERPRDLQGHAARPTLDRLCSGSVQAAALSEVESVDMDPELHVFVAEREEARDRHVLTREVPKPCVYESALLAEYGLARAELADRLGLSLKQVKRLLARTTEARDGAREDAAAARRARSRSRTSKPAGLRPVTLGGPAGREHLARCRRFRTFTTIKSAAPQDDERRQDRIIGSQAVRRDPGAPPICSRRRVRGRGGCVIAPSGPQRTAKHHKSLLEMRGSLSARVVQILAIPCAPRLRNNVERLPARWAPAQWLAGILSRYAHGQVMHGYAWAARAVLAQSSAWHTSDAAEGA